MDQFDQASELEQIARDKAIAYQRQKDKSNVTAQHCFECGNPIPESRRKAVKGVKYCIDCQIVNEKIGKTYAK